MPAPTIRLAVAAPNDKCGTAQRAAIALAPTVRLAHGGPLRANEAGLSPYLSAEEQPALLVSYVYLAAFQKERHKYGFRDWVLDSGAFSAHMSGTPISISLYTETARQLLAQDQKLVEVYALDVIGDWQASVQNAEWMWSRGVNAIPTFHRGSPWDVLTGLARDYPKVAIGGVARLPAAQKLAFAEQCFARVWPKRIHGFGFGAASHVMALPFDSVDATNWEMGPTAFGRWNTFGRMSVRGSNQDLRAEVEFYLKVEREARTRWAATWAGVEGRV